MIRNFRSCLEKKVTNLRTVLKVEETYQVRLVPRSGDQLTLELVCLKDGGDEEILFSQPYPDPEELISGWKIFTTRHRSLGQMVIDLLYQAEKAGLEDPERRRQINNQTA